MCERDYRYATPPTTHAPSRGLVAVRREKQPHQQQLLVQKQLLQAADAQPLSQDRRDVHSCAGQPTFSFILHPL